MPSIQSEYQKAILNARNRYLDELLPDVLEALEADYIRMLNDIVADFGTGAINEQRASDLYQSVIDRLEELSIRLGRTFDKAQLEAAELAVSGHAAGVKAVSKLAGTPVSFNFATVANKALEQYVTRRQTVGVATNFRTLFNRHIVEMAPEVDQFLTSAVGRGVGGRRGALELARMMARGEPGLLAQLDKVARGGTSHFTEIPGGAEYARLRKILYDARRIMVSETNNMYFEADRVASVESPVVDLVKWTISGRHHAVSSSPDACDVYAESDLHGYGPGIYHPENVPQKPHPHCILPGTEIIGSYTMGFRSYYAGKVFEIATARGHKLTVTPNHPILTEQGFVPAYSISNGNNLFSHTGYAPSRPEVNAGKDNAPPLIEDVFAALSEDSSSFFIERSSEYFHGDAKFGDGDIEVVGTAWELLVNMQRVLSKEISQFLFSFAHVSELGPESGTSTLEWLRFNGSPSGVLSRTNNFSGSPLFFPFFPFKPIGIGHGPDLNAKGYQSLFNSVSGNANISRDMKDWFAGKISLFNFVNTRINELTAGSVWLNDLEVDSVVSVCTHDYNGFVYDLESPRGVICANNITISNCLCQLSSITRPPADWGKPKRPVPTPRKSAEEQAREIMERSAEKVKSRGGSPRSITEKHLKRQNKIVNTGLKAANQALTETV